MTKYKSLHLMFSENFKSSLSRSECRDVNKFREQYELRSSHPEALNTPYPGVYRMYFLPKDQDFLFSLFDTSARNLRRDYLINVESYNPDFEVISDPYNLLTLWAAYCVRNSRVGKRDIEETEFSLLQLLHYKFYTSRINRLWQYGANEDIMIEAIENLSQKFDIKKSDTPTWKLVMAKRSEDIISDRSIHHQALTNFHPDDKVYYVLSDTQTRLRNKLNLVKDAFNEVKDSGRKHGYYSDVKEIDGTKFLQSLENRYSEMVIGVSRRALSTEHFINSEDISVICAMIKNVSPDMLRKFLIKFSGMAVTQEENHEAEKTKKGGKYPIFIGYKSMIRAIITVSYRATLKEKKTRSTSRRELMFRLISQYRASRISDEGIIATKDSVGRLVEEFGITRRTETKGALRLGFILYIVRQTFEYT